jgi:hypothetical protein
VLLRHVSEKRFNPSCRHRDRTLTDISELKVEEYREYGMLLGEHVGCQFRRKIFDQISDGRQFSLFRLLTLANELCKRTYAPDGGPQVRMFFPKHAENQKFAGTSFPLF